MSKHEQAGNYQWRFAWNWPCCGTQVSGNAGKELRFQFLLSVFFSQTET